MKKILILKFPYSSNFGGGERHTLDLVDNLSKKGFKFYLVSTCRVLLAEFKKRNLYHLNIWGGLEPVTKRAVLIFPFLAPFLFLEFLTMLFFYRFVKNVKTVYCLSLTEKMLATLPASLLGYKIFWIEHSMVDDWLTKNPWRFLYVMFSSLTTIICISKALADQIISLKIPRAHVKFIYPGIDLEKFTFSPKEPSQKIVVGALSRLDPEKGTKVLIKAASQIVKKLPQVKFHLVGSGQEKKRLENLVKKLRLENSVRFLGFRKSQEVIKTFDIFVLPSLRRESLGIVLLEGLASGVPVIASRVGGTQEIIEGNEVGFLVPPQDIKALTEAISDLALDKAMRQKMGEKGRKLVEDKFSMEKFIENFQKLLS